jgi:hypothetical protein
LRRPVGVSLISYFYLFGAIVLLFTCIFYDPHAESIGIAERFGLPRFPERLMRGLVAAFSFILFFGYMRLRKWGFWLMIAYSILFGAISVSLSFTHPSQPFIGNLIWSLLVLFYTLYVKKAFFRSRCS